MEFNINLFRKLLNEISSFRLFKVVKSGLVRMKCFSVVHRLNRFVRLE